MKQIIIILSVLSILVSSRVESNGASAVIPFYVYNAASRFGIDATLMYALCKVESQCKSRAVNRNDGTPDQKASGIKIKSYGLFQLQLSTVKSLGFIDHRITYVEKVRHGKKVKVKVVTDFSKELLKPEVNSFYAAKLLRKLYDKHRTTLRTLSAYNAGHPIKSNEEYVNKIVRLYTTYKLDKRF
jgi:Transglycosylase SLT domain